MLLGDLHGGAVVFYDSSNGGKTWVNQRFLYGEQVGGNPAVVPSRVTELADGSWLLSGSWYPGGKPWVGTEGEKLEFFRSTDRGKTWEFLSYLREDKWNLSSEILAASVIGNPKPLQNGLLVAQQEFLVLSGRYAMEFLTLAPAPEVTQAHAIPPYQRGAGGLSPYVST